jgi:hypothetical protein
MYMHINGDFLELDMKSLGFPFTARARYVVTTKSKAKAKAKPKSKSGLLPNLVPGTSEACSSSLKLWKPALFSYFRGSWYQP